MNAFIKKILSFFCFSGKRQNQRSQVAVIIALFIAVIVLLTIVYLNLTKISNIKMLTSNAVDKAALGVASRIGSLAHEYKVKYVPTYPAERCEFNLLGLLLGAVVAMLLLFVGPIFMISPVQAILTGIGISVSLTMSAGIGRFFTEMTARNSTREAAIYQILQGVVSDDSELRAVDINGQPGVFQETDAFGNFVGATYNLSAIPEMRRQRKVSRFQAWYYARRLPLVDDSFLRLHVTDFIDNVGWGVRRFVDIRPGDYNMARLKLDNIALVTDTFGLGGNAFDVSCASSPTCPGINPLPCPEWVKNAATDELIVLRLDANNDVVGGLLWDDAAGKMKSLFNRLQANYGGWFGLGPALIDPDDFTRLVNDLRDTLIRFKQVINMPVNQRVAGLQQWFSFFYDEEKHQCDPHNFPINDDPGNPNNFNDNYTWDIYLRLERSIRVIRDNWIPTLQDLNNNNIIDAPHVPDPGASYCQQGRGTPVGQCPVGTECGCWDDSENCIGDVCVAPFADATWTGTYGTCIGDGYTHVGAPVCTGGDFFAGIPSWCCDLRPDPCRGPDGCGTGSCTPPSGSPMGPRTEHYYQGQTAWSNTNAPSEVGQAIQVLWGIIGTMNKMQLSIMTLYQRIRQDIPPDPACVPCNTAPCGPNPLAVAKELLRNGAVYAWLDKPQLDGRPQYSHLVSVNVSNFPVYFPNITERVNWWLWVVPQRCVALHNAVGDITFRVNRYDQDQPTAWWNLRRRRAPQGAQYNPASLNAIVADIADGRIDTTAADVAAIEATHSISSSCQVNYGTERDEVRILTTN